MRGVLCAVILVAIGSIPLCSQQADTNDVNLTIDGESYQHVKWGRLTPTTVTIFHSTGVATIPLSKLPPDLQQKFGYDPQKAAAHLNAEQEREKARQQREAAYHQKLRYDQDTRLLLDGKLVETSQLQQVHGTILATPVTVKGDDGQTYTGTILEGAETRVAGYDIRQYPGLEGQGDYNAMIPNFVSENFKFFAKDFFPDDKIGANVPLWGVPINPVGGYKAWAIARKPSFVEWQKLQK